MKGEWQTPSLLRPGRSTRSVERRGRSRVLLRTASGGTRVRPAAFRPPRRRLSARALDWESLGLLECCVPGRSAVTAAASPRDTACFPLSSSSAYCALWCRLFAEGPQRDPHSLVPTYLNVPSFPKLTSQALSLLAHWDLEITNLERTASR